MKYLSCRPLLIKLMIFHLGIEVRCESQRRKGDQGSYIVRKYYNLCDLRNT